MDPDYQQLVSRIIALENLLKGYSPSFNDKVRDIVTYDIDNTTITTQNALDTQSPTPQVALDKQGFSITVPKNPDTYLRIRFRGTAYNLPVYKLS